MSEKINIEWEALSDDDFVARHEDYTLRVEQMDDYIWWWCVYYRDDIIADSSLCGYKQTEIQSKMRCVIYMQKHIKSKLTGKD